MAFFISVRGGIPRKETITSIGDIAKVDPSYVPLLGNPPTDPLTKLEIDIADDGTQKIATCTAIPMTLEEAKGKAILEAKRIASGLIQQLLYPYSLGEAIAWTQKEVEARIPADTLPEDSLLYVESKFIYQLVDNPENELSPEELDIQIRQRLARTQASVLEKATALRQGHGYLKAMQQKWEAEIKAASNLDEIRTLMFRNEGITLEKLGIAVEVI